MKNIKRPFLFILISFLAWGFSLIIINKISPSFLANRTSYEIEGQIPIKLRSTILPWLNFDGRNYLGIALHGYYVTGGQNLRGFFPLYPLLIKGIILTGLNPIYFGLALSTVFFLLSLILLYKYSSSKKAIILLILSPTAFYFLALYTESIFLSFVLCFFLSLKHKKYLYATIAAILASTTKVVGFALPAILLFSVLKNFKTNKKVQWITLLSPLGIVSILSYFFISTGDPLIFIKSQLTYNRRIGILSPILAFSDWTHKVFIGPQPIFDSPYVYPIIVLELFSSIFILIMIVKTFRKIPKPEWWYLTLSFLPVIFSGSLWSVPRYGLVMFPITIYLSKIFTGNKFIILCVASFSLQIILAALFLRGYWVS
jgi:hypothetical protein